MKNSEKQLFLNLCSFVSPDRDKIGSLVESGAATPELIGYLLTNRMGGVAYDVLMRTRYLGTVDREIKGALKCARFYYEKYNEDFFGCLNYLSTLLDACGAPYALLKGAYLCGKYPTGYRTSNDIDVLINPEDVGKISTKLKLAGFKQGYIKNGKLVEATRQQIIESKMTRGETVPFIKEIKLPYIKHLEVDLNFSLDYKNNDNDSVRKMLEKTQTIAVGKTKIRTLCDEDFFLHLCAHLYKEATTVPWIRMKRDMTFYKYTDIYMLINELNDEQQEMLIHAAKENGLEKEFAYCINSINSFFNMSDNMLMQYIKSRNNADLEYVVAPSEKKLYRYTEKDVVKRFFAKDRMKLLEEVTSCKS